MRQTHSKCHCKARYAPYGEDAPPPCKWQLGRNVPMLQKISLMKSGRESHEHQLANMSALAMGAFDFYGRYRIARRTRAHKHCKLLSIEPLMRPNSHVFRTAVFGRLQLFGPICAPWISKARCLSAMVYISDSPDLHSYHCPKKP